jgi:hypothetical protein
MSMMQKASWLLVVPLLVGPAACSRQVSIEPEPPARSQAAPPGAGNNGLLARVSTPETDPDQYEIHSFVVNPGDPPTKVLEGPIMLVGAPILPWVYAVDGPDCSAPPVLTYDDVANFCSGLGGYDNGCRVPIRTGRSVCSFFPPGYDQPIAVRLKGYRPYN